MFRTVRLLGHAAVTACMLFGFASAGTAGAAQSACADLGGTVDGDQICHVHSATPTYMFDFRFPVGYPDQQPVTNYLTQRRDQFVQAAADFPPPDWRRDLPYELDASGTTYGSGSQASGTESLVFRVLSETGGAHPVTDYEAFNYDLSKGASITFDTLFKPGTKPLDVIYPIVRGELQMRFGSEAMYGGLDAKTYRNFAITDDAVIFFFGQGYVLSEAAGPVEVSVPRTELVSLLA
jgi:Protein of unknown function (DUF3298)